MHPDQNPPNPLSDPTPKRPKRPKRPLKVELNELWEADPKCKHNIIAAPGGGIKCTKCRGWCCL